jgi:hypothetical protein
MEPNIIINQTLNSICQQSKLLDETSSNYTNSLNLEKYKIYATFFTIIIKINSFFRLPAGIIYSHLNYIKQDLNNSNAVSQQTCTMAFTGTVNQRLQIIFKEFSVPHYEKYENEIVNCADSFIISEVK